MRLISEGRHVIDLQTTRYMGSDANEKMWMAANTFGFMVAYLHFHSSNRLHSYELVSKAA